MEKQRRVEKYAFELVFCDCLFCEFPEKSGVKLIGSLWYYLNGQGVMCKNCWIGNYYLTSSGAMATNTWIGRYHVNANGVWDKTR